MGLFSKLYESLNTNNMILYHGTNKEFDSFDAKLAGRTDSGFMGKGFYMSGLEYLAQAYADDSAASHGGEAHVLKFKINAKKTLEIGSTGEYYDAIEKVGVTSKDRVKQHDELRKLGYDSVAVVRSGKIREFVALDQRIYKRIK